jgi:phosphatidylserine decarboxylase
VVERFEQVSRSPTEASMKKRIYRKTRIQDVRAEGVSAALAGERIIFAVDVAKEDMVGVLVGADMDKRVTIGWKNPYENEQVAALLTALRAQGRSVEVVA